MYRRHCHDHFSDDDYSDDDSSPERPIEYFPSDRDSVHSITFDHRLPDGSVRQFTGYPRGNIPLRRALRREDAGAQGVQGTEGRGEGDGADSRGEAGPARANQASPAPARADSRDDGSAPDAADARPVERGRPVSGFRHVDPFDFRPRAREVMEVGDVLRGRPMYRHECYSESESDNGWDSDSDWGSNSSGSQEMEVFINGMPRGWRRVHWRRW